MFHHKHLFWLLHSLHNYNLASTGLPWVLIFTSGKYGCYFPADPAQNLSVVVLILDKVCRNKTFSQGVAVVYLWWNLHNETIETVQADLGVIKPSRNPEWRSRPRKWAASIPESELDKVKVWGRRSKTAEIPEAGGSPKPLGDGLEWACAQGSGCEEEMPCSAWETECLACFTWSPHWPHIENCSRDSAEFYARKTFYAHWPTQVHPSVPLLWI